MREIKFRGRCVYTNEWFYGDLIQDKYTCSIGGMIDAEIYSQSTVYKETVSQYTGLKDKNGREIYEGDVLSYWGFTFVVKHQNAAFGWIEDREFHSFASMAISEIGNTKIIGNIYEHHELLEG